MEQKFSVWSTVLVQNTYTHVEKKKRNELYSEQCEKSVQRINFLLQKENRENKRKYTESVKQKWASKKKEIKVSKSTIIIVGVLKISQPISVALAAYILVSRVAQRAPKSSPSI